MPEGANRSALIHQLSKRRTQIPFSKSKGLIQCVLFHPVKPCLFVAVSLYYTLIVHIYINPNKRFVICPSTTRPRRTFESTIWSNRSWSRSCCPTANGFRTWPSTRRVTICWCPPMTRRCCGSTWICPPNRTRRYACTRTLCEALRITHAIRCLRPPVTISR